MIRIDEQIQAITTIDENLAVNAGAGTGKTRVLTERYLYILENGKLEKNKEVESIVAITFTKKASQEMKERIREAIRGKFSQDKKWMRFYNDMEKANISTIHSFCANMLRENALKINVDPIFSILEPNEADKILNDAIKDILIRTLEEDEVLLNMMLYFKKEKIEYLSRDIKNIYYKIRNGGYSIEYIKGKTYEYLNSINLTKEDLNGLVEDIKDKFIYLMKNTRKDSKFNKLKGQEEWIKFYEGNYSQEEFYPILEYLYENMGSAKKLQDIINGLKSSIEKVFQIREKEFSWCYDMFFKLLENTHEEYNRRKNDLGALDYEDLQILTLKLLEDEAVRREYQNKYRYIMIDEFQDTNELQKKIFYKLCSRESLLDRNNLFVVGDPKQSIYRFRGADVDVFYQVVEDIERVSGKRAIDLSINFRSVDTILNFVNKVFSKLMGPRYIALNYTHKSPNPIDVEILEKKDIQVPESFTRSEYEKYVESRLIAGRIKELVEEGRFKYRDFCLLFRASTDDSIYEDALQEFGIPYYNVGGKGFFESQEIKDLINALKAISNRYDTIATIGFLRSPMIGLSDRTIYWLLRNKEASLYDTLNKDINNIEEDERIRVEKAKSILDEFMVKKDFYGVSLLLKELVHRTLFKEYLLLKPNGRQMVLNVEKFMDICNEFDRSSTSSLEDFIDYIEEIKNSREADEAKAKIYSEDADVVKLMTIHKSKGLQFPVVIIPQMARKKANDYSLALYHKDLGLGLRIDKLSPLINRIKEQIALEEEEEEKRILYVAMTRAKYRLILGCQGQNSGFKKMIKDLINTADVYYIDKEYEKPKIDSQVREIDIDLCPKPVNYNVFPLLNKIDGFNKKAFVNFSVSQYLDFAECRRKFYLKYYRNLPIDLDTGNGRNIVTIDAITKGNIVHKFCQHYRKGINERDLLRQAIDFYGVLYSKELEEELFHYIRNYLDLYVEDFDEYYTEKEFFLKVASGYIRGTIDRINIRKGKCEILDFKTNKVIDLNSLKEKYQPQLKLYANAVKQITGMEIRRAAILFLDTKDLVEVDISEEALNKNLESINKFIAFVKYNNLIDQYEKRKNCKLNCEYSIFCKYD